MKTKALKKFIDLIFRVIVFLFEYKTHFLHKKIIKIHKNGKNFIMYENIPLKKITFIVS